MNEAEGMGKSLEGEMRGGGPKARWGRETGRKDSTTRGHAWDVIIYYAKDPTREVSRPPRGVRYASFPCTQ
jgi:hypothetical protein